MRWGVRDEATDDHMTTELCMTEIDNCQRLSVGPNFVVSIAAFSFLLRTKRPELLEVPYHGLRWNHPEQRIRKTLRWDRLN